MAKKKIERTNLLTTLEVGVIKSVIALGDDAYGVTVFNAIRSINHSLAFASVYTALERLTWKGYLEARLGDPQPARGGRAKKFYRVTDRGMKALNATLKFVTSDIVVTEFVEALD